MRFIQSILILVLFIFVLAQDAQARVLPRYRNNDTSSKATISTQSSNTITVRPSFMPGRGGLHVAFSNLQNATSVKYVLSYTTSGKLEGVSGVLSETDGNNASRDLQFATCSSGVCRNHGTIEKMKLIITSKLTNGKTSIKRYRIKV